MSKKLNKKALKIKLAYTLSKAYLDRDIEGLHKAAQAIFAAGYEMEEMDITPTLLVSIMNALVETNWVPIGDAT